MAARSRATLISPAAKPGLGPPLPADFFESDFSDSSDFFDRSEFFDSLGLAG